MYSAVIWSYSADHDLSEGYIYLLFKHTNIGRKKVPHKSFDLCTGWNTARALKPVIKRNENETFVEQLVKFWRYYRGLHKIVQDAKCTGFKTWYLYFWRIIDWLALKCKSKMYFEHNHSNNYNEMTLVVVHKIGCDRLVNILKLLWIIQDKASLKV